MFIVGYADHLNLLRANGTDEIRNAKTFIEEGKKVSLTVG